MMKREMDRQRYFYRWRNDFGGIDDFPNYDDYSDYGPGPDPYDPYNNNTMWNETYYGNYKKSHMSGNYKRGPGKGKVSQRSSELSFSFYGITSQTDQ